jgi:hypothetical protein
VVFRPGNGTARRSAAGRGLSLQGFGSPKVNKERSVMPWVRESIEAKNMRREMRNTTSYSFNTIKRYRGFLAENPYTAGRF